jgi:RNA polymerase sigma-70 factor (ECF subfamily)
VNWEFEIATRADVEAVYRSHGGMVWRAVLVMAAGDRGVADDATAEAFARLLAYGAGVRDPVAWVFRTAFGVAAKELGRASRIAPGVVPDGVVADTAASALPSELTQMLRELSPDQRAAVFLHYVADLPVREIARLSGSTTATVKVRLHRARQSLKSSMTGGLEVDVV